MSDEFWREMTIESDDDNCNEQKGESCQCQLGTWDLGGSKRDSRRGAETVGQQRGPERCTRPLPV